MCAKFLHESPYYFYLFSKPFFFLLRVASGNAINFTPAAGTLFLKGKRKVLSQAFTL
jgi:hypothetical protein